MPVYNIADLNVKMNCESKLCLERGEKYRVSDDTEPDIVIDRDKERIERNVKEYPQMNANEWEYMIFGSGFYNRIINFDGMMLHASAVVVDGKAYLFSAHCGTGKSTHTSLWLKLFGEKAYIINDDKPAIRMIDGVPYVYGTPFSGKHDISRNTKARLAGICFISQAPENKISTMPTQEAIVKVLEQTIRRLSYDNMDKMLSVLDKILSSITVYSLECNMDISAAVLSYETMSGEKLNDR